MSSAELSDTQLTDLILKGVQKEFEQLLKKKLEEVAAEVTKQVAEQAAKSVSAQVVHYHRNIVTDQVQVHVQFGEKK